MTTHYCLACGGSGKLHFTTFTIICYRCNGEMIEPRPRVATTDFISKPYLPEDMRKLITDPIPSVEITPEEEEEFRRMERQIEKRRKTNDDPPPETP